MENKTQRLKCEPRFLYKRQEKLEHIFDLELYYPYYVLFYKWHYIF